MRRIVRLLSALVLAAAAHGAAGAAGDRPRVGLVLSGGSAHGLAHVGVLLVLEELRVPVDVVAGTSMGSIVGGLYASGMSPGEMERLLLMVDWEDLFDDRPSRERLSYRRKQDRDHDYIDLEMGLGRKGVTFPSGLVAGQKLSFLLKSLTLGSVGASSFDALPLPFRCVATDIASGEKVVLSDGSLAEAIRASLSLPGVFSPVRRGNRLLVDGGLVENLPVAEAEAMGAEVIIAVDVSTGRLDPEKLQSFSGILGRTVSLPIKKNVAAAFPRASVVVEPEVGDIPSMDFDRAAELISRGEAAARAAASELSRLSVPEDEYRAFLAGVRGARPPLPRVDSIQTICTGVDTRQVTSRLSTKTGRPLDVETLRRDLDRIYEMGVFETVDFRLVADEGQNVLVIEAKPKSWGPTFLRVGTGLEANFDGEATVSLRGTVHAMQLNKRGGELKMTLEVGTLPGLSAELYQPLDFRGRYFASVEAAYSRSLARVSVPGGPVGEGRLSLLEGSVGAGVAFGSFGALRVGILGGDGVAEPLLTQAPLEEVQIDLGGLFAHVAVDTLDNLSFPRRGFQGVLEINSFQKGLGTESSFDLFRARGALAVPLGRRTAAVFTAGLEDSLGTDPPFYMLAKLADFSRVAALARENEAGQRAALASVMGTWRLAGLPTRLGRGFYLGGILEAGQVWEKAGQPSLRGPRAAGSVFAGADTVLGPIYAGLGFGYGGATTLYVFVGRPF